MELRTCWAQMLKANGFRCRNRPPLRRPRRLIIMVCTIVIIIVLFIIIIIHVGAFLLLFNLETDFGILGQIFREEAMQIHEQLCVCRYMVPSINPYGIANMLGPNVKSEWLSL